MSVTDKSLMTSGSLFVRDGYCFLAEELFWGVFASKSREGFAEGFFLPSPETGLLSGGS